MSVFELYVIAMFVRQSTVNSEISISFIGSVNGNLRLSGWLVCRDGIILFTIPGIVVLGRSGIREVARFNSAIFADLAMRGFAISFATLARVALSGCVFLFLYGMLTS
jgi:hypothetical protein